MWRKTESCPIQDKRSNIFQLILAIACNETLCTLKLKLCALKILSGKYHLVSQAQEVDDCLSNAKNLHHKQSLHV